MSKKKEIYNFAGMFVEYRNTLNCLYEFGMMKAKITEKKEKTGKMNLKEYDFDQKFDANLSSSIHHISHIAIENGYKMNIELLKGHWDDIDEVHELGELKKTLFDQIDLQKKEIIEYLNVIYDYFWTSKGGEIIDNYHGTLACALKSLNIGVGFHGFFKKKNIQTLQLFDILKKSLDWVNNSHKFHATRYGIKGVKVDSLSNITDILVYSNKVNKNIEILDFIKMVLDNYFEYQIDCNSYKRKPDKNKKNEGESEIYGYKCGDLEISYQKIKNSSFTIRRLFWRLVVRLRGWRSGGELKFFSSLYNKKCSLSIYKNL